MAAKPTYEELEQSVKALEQASLEFKQVEEALRESEEKYRLLVNNLPGFVFQGYKDWSVEFFDRKIELLTGYEIDEFNSKNILWIDILFKEDIEIARESFIRALKSKKSYIREYRIKSKTEEIHWIQERGDIACNSKGEIEYVSGIFFNITDHKQAEEALKESEATLKSIFRAAPIGIGLVYNRVIKQANDRLCEMVGYSRDELLEQSARMLYPTEKEFEYVGQEKYDQIKRFGTGTVETRWQRKDGKVIHIWLSSTPLDPEDLSVGVTFTALDITEQVQAVEALKVGKERYQDLVENINDVIYAVSTEGIVTYVSPAVEPQMGYRPSEIVGKNFTEFVYPDDLPFVMEQFQRILTGKVEPSQYRLVTKTGEILWIRSSSRPAYKGDAIVGFRGSFVDITHSKQMEQQLRQSQKMEAIGTLTGGIAHDFNNILGIIVGNAELAMDDVPEWNPAHFNLEEIKTASLRAKDVVRQLLSFARKADQERKPIKINSIITDSLKLLRSSIPASIEIRRNIQRESETILGDPTQINQIMINLCTNAAHAMAKEGGVLEIGLHSVALDEAIAKLHDLPRGRYIKLAVSDTGFGITPEIIDRIFDPYFTTKEVGEGSGLGLAVVHGIIMSHDGAISVESELGQGTTINIFLPVIEKTPVPETAIGKDLPTGKERILFVDDEKSIVKMASQRLERLGYKVEATTSPLEALDIYRSKPDRFDLVITDLTMPKMTGDKLMKEILNIRPDTPIILCTGFSEKINGEKAKEIGATDYLEKPHDKRDLAIMVRRVLDGK